MATMTALTSRGASDSRYRPSSPAMAWAQRSFACCHALEAAVGAVAVGGAVVVVLREAVVMSGKRMGCRPRDSSTDSTCITNHQHAHT